MNVAAVHALQIILERNVGAWRPELRQRARAAGGGEPETRRAALFGKDDAFATLLQWLYARMPHTRVP